MGEVHYMISEAAKRVDVEAHVLRYWGGGIDIPIVKNRRNGAPLLHRRKCTIISMH